MNTFFTNLTSYSLLIAVAIFIGGILPIFRRWKSSHLPIALSLASGLMLGSAFFHLIPESFKLAGAHMGFGMMAGFLFLFFIESFITVHICELLDCEVHHQLSISAFLGIGIHTLVDGIALGSGLMVPGLGFIVFFAVVAHKAPEMFSLSSLLLHLKTPRRKIILLNFIIWLTIPLGALIAYLVLQVENNFWLGSALAFSAGTFIHISLSDLLPEAHKHSPSKKLSTLMLLLGISFMALIEILWGV